MTIVTPKMLFSHVAWINWRHHNFSILVLMHWHSSAASYKHQPAMLSLFFGVFLLFAWLRTVICHPPGGQQYERQRTCSYCNPEMNKQALFIENYLEKTYWWFNINVSVWAWIRGKTDSLKWCLPLRLLLVLLLLHGQWKDQSSSQRACSAFGSALIQPL